MIITKVQPADNGIIKVNSCVRVLRFLLIEDIVTFFCVTDPLGNHGIDMQFIIKKTGQSVDEGNLKKFVGTLVNKDDEVWHVFGEDPQTIEARMNRKIQNEQ